MSEAEALEGGRLKWRCRRGMKELDVLLERYAQELMPPAPAAERRAFGRLLDLSDPQIASYLLGHEAPADAELARLIQRIAAGAHPGGEERR